MEDHGPNQKKRHNAFGVFVDKPLGNPTSGAYDQDHKKLKPNSEAPLSTLEQQIPALPLPNLLVSAFKENPTRGVKFQLFMSRSFTTPTSTSPPPVYTLKVTSSSNSTGEVEPAGIIVDGGATAVLRETRLVAEGQFVLRSRL
ncbi:uncharacterized protein LOC113863958 [Abrus precatorius]|uniref:Uncharacterized protein LOC113863958 n=1 Tax=Abrus precatorius TaxID=3816 RepID=A0A8B8LB51_ABRPR|nr:uncharacterized protein LOC113863958 [Abrus precatorius]